MWIKCGLINLSNPRQWSQEHTQTDSLHCGQNSFLSGQHSYTGAHSPDQTDPVDMMILWMRERSLSVSDSFMGMVFI